MRSPLLITVGVALVIAGCGSSHKSNHNNPGLVAGIKFADCMRANGVSNFSDPSGGGGGVQIPNSVDVNSPAFQHAQKACRSLMPGGGARSPATADQKLTMLRLSQCMRAHGVSGFPDPVSSPPGSPVGMAVAFGRPGAFLVIPQTLNPQSPAFKTAAKACHFPGT